MSVDFDDLYSTGLDQGRKIICGITGPIRKNWFSWSVHNTHHTWWYNDNQARDRMRLALFPPLTRKEADDDLRVPLPTVHTHWFVRASLEPIRVAKRERS